MGGILELESLSLATNKDRLSVDFIEFTSTDNIKTEILTVLEVMKRLESKSGEKVRHIIYSDCQTVCQLPERRIKLEASHFKSKKSGRELANASLYKEFFHLFDAIQVEIRFLKGHKPKEEKTLEDQIFAVVDQATRKYLRKLLSEER